MDTQSPLSPDAAPVEALVFAGARLLARGPVADVAVAAKIALEQDPSLGLLVFDSETCRPLELDLRGSVDEVRQRHNTTRRVAGRPKLGVVAREVTLLPRHWEWLNEQPGGASVTLRKLVDQARHAQADAERTRKQRDKAYRFMLVLAGDRPGFEEASRALFAGDYERLAHWSENWPVDIQNFLHEILGNPPQADAKPSPDHE